MTEDYSEKTARQILSLIDLTDLRDECRQEDVVALCERAQTTYGNTAAICIWPRFVADARSTLGRNSSIKIATVVNFPDGTASCMDVVEETSRAIEDGADEIDLVIPYRAFLDGDEDIVTEMVRAVRKVCGGPIRLKTILETGVLGQEALIRRAAVLSLEAGADFIKTSTGKVKLNATIEAATLILPSAQRLWPQCRVQTRRRNKIHRSGCRVSANRRQSDGRGLGPP